MLLSLQILWRNVVDTIVREKLLARIATNAQTGCWEWTAAKDAYGYGAVYAWGKVRKAHRVSYEIHKGPIPIGLDILHSCDNPGCLNPDHLSPGTDKDNAADRVSRGRQAREKSLPQTKLSDSDVIAIRASSGVMQLELAKRYGVHPTLISHIRRNKVRRHLLT